jgi:formate-dependent nitrite reductase membrane component NrfD
VTAQPNTREGMPVIKAPVWSREVPLYLYFGGLAGAGAGVAWAADLAGERELARRAWLVSLAGVTASPALLVSDLGYPRRFLNMLRVFKVTSPMSVGSWLLAASGGAIGLSALDAVTGRVPRRLAAAARPAAALLGMPLATYTGALLADTAVPVWHEARAELPATFAAAAAASAGAALIALTPPRHAAMARRLTVLGSVAELGAMEAMRWRLGDTGQPYRSGTAGRLGAASRALFAAGAGVVAAAGARSRPAAVAGGALVTAGAVLARWSVFRAGFQSAADPAATVELQRRRMRAAP